MKFSDFFLPKIVRSDPKVRIDAVNKTKDPTLLQQVISNDKSEQVREVAAQRLKALQETDGSSPSDWHLDKSGKCRRHSRPSVLFLHSCRWP
jgi:hypothetical protein